MVPVNELLEFVDRDQRVGLLVAFGFLASAFPPYHTVRYEGNASLWNKDDFYD
jgi:hypothetical protein